MGFIKPSLPVSDYADWAALPRAERLRVLVQSWAERGFGTPDAVLLLYVFKLIGYAALGLWLVSLTPGIGGLGDIAHWWTEPVVFQKIVIFTMLVEVMGFGGASGPLTMRFLPPVGTFVYWLRPGTIRQPPWARYVPLTRGDPRTVVDVLLYVALVGVGLWLVVGAADGSPGNLPATVGVLEPRNVALLLGVLAVCGLRDKTIFLAARSEVYGTLALTFVIISGIDSIVAAKLVFLLIWWGAAFSKLNHHFPHVISVMMSNSPVFRTRWIKRRLHVSWPDDIRPSAISRLLAHGGTVIEFGVPLVLFLSRGGPVTMIAAIVMVLFHLQILTSLPMGVPLEWNIFMIFGIGFLFVDKAQYGLADIAHPWPVALLAAGIVATVVLGNLYPQYFSFLMAMRYYAGNWATSWWCVKDSALAKFDDSVIKSSQLPHQQIARLFDEQTADVISHQILAFRAMHTHGRALLGLVVRAAGPTHETNYQIIDGELICGTSMGWNFGDMHLHDERLIASLQRRCRFDAGEVRVILLESQPFLRPRQSYRIVDAATGEIERGYVNVSDMLRRQPWHDDIPVHVTASSATSLEWPASTAG